MAVTTDNASNMKKAIKRLGKFQWIGCFGHTLNLVIKRSLKRSTTSMSDAFESENESNSDEDEERPVKSKEKADKSAFGILKLKFKKLATFLHKSSNAKEEFEQCQETLNMKMISKIKSFWGNVDIISLI